MGMCKSCGEVVNSSFMINGFCPDCQSSQEQETHSRLKKIASLSDKEKKRLFDSIELSTETYINSKDIQRLGIISVQRVYGMFILKDLFTGIRNLVGGRVNNIESAMAEAKKEIEQEFREKAFCLGANTVIAITIQQTFANNNIVSFFALGTAIFDKNKE